jgi:hypothetical protein
VKKYHVPHRQERPCGFKLVRLLAFLFKSSERIFFVGTLARKKKHRLHELQNSHILSKKGKERSQTFDARKKNCHPPLYVYTAYHMVVSLKHV